ncbi:MAG: DUF1887 family CARF protein [candidate division KSB1 bacterium]|nr:DUF1887 family CARF protein [candidate division KSB1 bacterium]
MATIMISLISEQTIPNFLLIKQMQNVDRHLFITTEQMEQQGKRQALISALGLSDDCFLEPLVVKKDDLEDIERCLQSVEFADDDRFIVNVTGGTKIMSLAVYNFFRERESEIYYIPIGKNLYWKIFPRVRQKLYPLAYRVNLTEYLTAYGIEITNPKNIHQLVRSAEETRRFFDFFVDMSDNERGLLNDLRKNREVAEKSMSELPELVELLQRSPFQPKDAEWKKLAKEEVRYLIGGWFEEYVYDLYRAYFDLKDPFIGCSIQIRKQEVNNELDIAFVYENALYVIECKTGIGSSQDKDIMEDAIYKLEALRREFGLQVFAYIFTLSRPGKERNQVKDKHYQRAEKLFGINIVDGETLQNPQALTKVLEKIKRKAESSSIF